MAGGQRSAQELERIWFYQRAMVKGHEPGEAGRPALGRRSQNSESYPRRVADGPARLQSRIDPFLSTGGRLLDLPGDGSQGPVDYFTAGRERTASSSDARPRRFPEDHRKNPRAVAYGDGLALRAR